MRKIICSYPRSTGSIWFEELWRAGEIELELVPQGTLSERMRAAGAGLGGFFTPTGADTLLAEGKEVRVIDGRRHVFEEPLPGRRRPDQGRPRRPLGQPRLPHGGAQLRPDDGRGGRADRRPGATSSWSSASWTRRPS